MSEPDCSSCPVLQRPRHVASALVAVLNTLNDILTNGVDVTKVTAGAPRYRVTPAKPKGEK